jgi:hypothetical protein
LGTSNYVDEGNGEYLTIGLNNRFQLNTKLNTIVGMWWSKYKYGSGDERFIYTYPVKLEYAINKWLSGDLAYKFELAKSDNDLYRYSDNVFSIGVKVEF